MKDEALKLALEALEWNLSVIEDYGDKEQLSRQHKAIDAMRKDLEKSRQESATGIQYTQGIPFFVPPPAQPAPVQEPVAWRWVPSKVWQDYVLSDDPQKAALAQEHGIEVEALCKCATPPAAQRQWVGLTAGERDSLFTEHYQWDDYGKGIEAKLKEKNT
jgi:hypothetical protein